MSDTLPSPVQHDDGLAVFERRESRVRTYSRSFPTVFTRAKGSRIWDEDDREFIDFFAGACALNYGHNDPGLVEALQSYVAGDGIVHGLDMATEAKRDFLVALEDRVLTPRGLDYRVQFTAPTGSDAVEAAIKLARLRTGRRGIAAFTRGYHGVTLGALATTSDRVRRRGAGTELTGVTMLPYEGFYGDLDTLPIIERTLNDPGSGVDLPAAVIVETVQGEGGVIPASPEWLRGVARICAEAGVLLIADEIQSGCGRTGDFFGFEEAGIVPDLVTVSKSISGIGLPLALLLIRPDHDVWERGAHSGTFRGDNLAFVTGAAALDLFWSDDRLAERVRASERRIRERLSEATGLTVRGRGLLLGLDTGEVGGGKAVSRAAFDAGLIAETAGPGDEIVRVSPPLVIDDETLDAGLTRLIGAVAAARA